MIRIAIFGNTFQADRATQIKPIFDMLKKINARLSIDAEYYTFIQENFNLTIDDIEIIDDNNFHTDIAISIGGDGTFLRTAERVGEKKIPILGINTGRLGFLADVTLQDVDAALIDIYKNHYTVEDRKLLELTIDDYDQPYKRFALNEISILKLDNASMISIDVDIDHNKLSSYEADGLIVATPTGSTAYSLSVGGPILEPDASNFVISPVAPHSLTARPLVIKDSCTLDICVRSRTNSFQVSVDGTSHTLNISNKINIKKAPYSTKVIKRKGYTFYDTLRNKLFWGADSRG